MRLVVDFNPQRAEVNVKGLPMVIGLGNNVVKEYVGGLPYYEGSYVVEPSAHEDIVLETADLAMRNDVTVKKIYYAEVSNLSNGMTAYIAEHE